MADLLADTEFAGNHSHLPEIDTLYVGNIPLFKLHDATGKPFQIQPFRVGSDHWVIGGLTELLYKLYITTSIYCGISDDFLK